MTVTRERGHGTVTLPADYAREHVRLGYAATEHGYQSDTVDHSIALDSTVTTRRGLYVAATRGRDENLICVVTDSDDVAEARDVLETILAFDRDDVPAVTQRRTLAQQQPAIAPPDRLAAVQRCELPEWFEPLRAATRRDLDAAEQAATASAVQRGRVAASVTSAERHLAQVEAETAPARHMVAIATRRVDHAWLRHADAQRQNEAAGIRGRRQAHRDVELTALRLELATDFLASNQRSADPHVDNYRRAQAQVEQARDALHGHCVIARLDRADEHVATLRRRLDMLDCWRRWAEGDSVTNAELDGLVGELVEPGRRGKDAGEFRALGQALAVWAGATGIRLRNPPLLTRRRERTGPELGR